MVATTIIEKVRQYSNIIRNSFPVKQVILYGSFARGTERAGSDIDVAVILREEPANLLDAEAELFRLRRDIDLRIEPTIVEEEPDLSGFFEDISSYGMVVYSA